PRRQRYHCHGCRKRFDDLTGTIFAGHHQPLRVWILCLYFMGLNLSNEQIAQELGIDPDDAQVMASRLREGIVARKPEVQLGGEVECDEVYVVAGHKGHPSHIRSQPIQAYPAHPIPSDPPIRSHPIAPSFVREPQGNGVAERFVSMLKENLLWI